MTPTWPAWLASPCPAGTVHWRWDRICTCWKEKGHIWVRSGPTRWHHYRDVVTTPGQATLSHPYSEAEMVKIVTATQRQAANITWLRVILEAERDVVRRAITVDKLQDLRSQAVDMPRGFVVDVFVLDSHGDVVSRFWVGFTGESARRDALSWQSELAGQALIRTSLARATFAIVRLEPPVEFIHGSIRGGKSNRG